MVRTAFWPERGMKWGSHCANDQSTSCRASSCSFDRGDNRYKARSRVECNAASWTVIHETTGYRMSLCPVHPTQPDSASETVTGNRWRLHLVTRSNSIF